MRAPRTSLLLLLGAAACVTEVHDPFETAQLALREHDLVGALLAYDAVPVAHARYPEAHAAAVNVECRIRRCHEMLLEALTLRAEWRDVDALGFLRLARAVWPTLPAVNGLIVATENRIRLFEPGSNNEVRRDPLAQPAAPSPAGEIEPSSASTAAADPLVAAEVSLPGNASAPQTGDDTTGAVEPAVGTATSTDAVARGLAQVELYLANNDVQEAVADLFELARRFPNDARVQARLARLLHQRALLLYGQGSVSGAIADWEHLLEIYPSHPLAADLLRAARSEASPAPNHRPGRSRVRNGSPR